MFGRSSVAVALSLEEAGHSDGSSQPLPGAEGVASSTPEFWEANGSQRAESTAVQPSVVADSAAVEMDAEAQLLQAACRPVHTFARVAVC